MLWRCARELVLTLMVVFVQGEARAQVVLDYLHEV